MNTSAFIVEDKIHAIYENGKLYFQSYTIANQIFSLIDFVTEATNTEIELFGEIKGIDVNAENIKHIANIKTRRLIKLLSSTNNIATFMRKTFRTKTSLLKKYGINAQINGNNELVLPTNNVVELNRTLEFFYGIGAIICSLVTIDTIRELYFISTAWGHETTWHDILYTVRKVLAILGWILLTWYVANKCCNIQDLRLEYRG
jgi:hypothetical protein